MSEENVEVVRRGYEALERRDWDALFRHTDPDFLLETEIQGSFPGREAAQGFIEDQIEAFEVWSAEPVKFFEVGDCVLVFVNVRARPRGTSAEIEIKIAHLWTLRDGTVLRLHTFPKREEALKAAGLSE